MNVLLSLLLIALFISAGVWLAAVVDRALGAWRAGTRPDGLFMGPFREAAAMLARPRAETEAPDALFRLLAPGWYLALAAVSFSVVPFAPGIVATAPSTGLVLWGACEALVIVVVFIHGWAPNSPFPLIGAYRYVVIGLPAMLPSMFVLIAAALPAESLALPTVVESQRELWNVVRQPLGMVLFLAIGLTITLRGPFDYADPEDLAGGTSAEESGPALALWRLARLAMLVSFSAMAATVFLGGFLGPWLPGPVWLALKALAVMVATQAVGHLLPRMPAPRMLAALWLMALPLSFADLLLVGLESLA
ncbi:MAG: NADH:ubiquinone oxidoreductase subunit 1 (chain H) [Rhizobiales bacterium NRL2]|jgi:NADH-quinone oxidoreductase subunit H|nr:MAG: NADH:ubiquinone oxidoreductase subunit 1 (chain H) [Rhizobiales bacterium NRL2]